MLIAPLLVAMAYSDLNHMRIPNVLCLIALAVFGLAALIAPPDDLVARIVVAGSVFALGFAAFCLRILGGGDVKMLSALLLFVPVPTMPLFALVFSASMLAGIAIVLGLRRLPAAHRLGWKSISGSTGFPMGLSIAMAGLLHPAAAMLIDAERILQ
ncbi:prepilin peptidase [Pseudotabrizicola sediminis]|uniref:prepilin peptidase n=1 Tax=Pseudotabrizicola sediminis TaxID=2486418 RepID=UPI00143670BE|nr:prepilin peptidase [Pseudotabrizicola sediminis]